MKPELIVALDFNRYSEARRTIDFLDNLVTYYKVGLEAFVSFGPSIIEYLKLKDKKVFLDLKFHDIPNTVSAAAMATTAYHVDIINVHIQGGKEMLRNCKQEIEEHCASHRLPVPLIIGVTMLTSLDKDYFFDYGLKFEEPMDYVLHLAGIARDAGLNGVVASAKETSQIKKIIGENFITITPGIRPYSYNDNDQKRVLTPAEAKKTGTDFIVVGRPIIRADDPVAATKMILKDLI